MKNIRSDAAHKVWRIINRHDLDIRKIIKDSGLTRESHLSYLHGPSIGNELQYIIREWKI